jgi:acetylornithine deacetylase
MTANYGTDMPHLQGDFVRYLYGPGTIFVAHGPNENVTVGDLEASVEGYQRLIHHALDDKQAGNVGSEL